MPFEHLASGRDGVRGDALAQVLFEGLYDFGLRPIAFDDGGAGFFDAGKCLIDNVPANAARDGVGFDTGEKFREGRPRGRSFVRRLR